MDAILTSLALPFVLTIRLYATSEIGLPSPAARTETALVLAEAGISSRWTFCGQRHPERACTLPLAPSELAVRLVRERSTRAGDAPMTMGTSLVDTTRRTGVLATVYLDRIEALAASAGQQADIVLARALAHEIAHLVLGTTEHGASGLMRPLWSRAMLRDEPSSSWVFTPGEAASLRAALAARR